MRLVLACTALVATLTLAPYALSQETAAPTERVVVVRFPGLEAARVAMTDDAVEPYISTLQTAEMSAKTGSPITGEDLAAQRDECRKRYELGTLQFDEDEQEDLTWLAGEVTRAWLAEYPLLADLPWSFIKTGPAIEGGLPHTRGAHIVLTGGVVHQIGAFRARDEARAVRAMGGLLIHEQLHVAERSHPEVFAKLFTELWGFEHVAELPTCEWLERNQVVNPDGVDVRWVRPFQRGDETIYVYPRVMFRDGEGPKRMPWDFRMVGILVTKTEDGSFALQLDDDGVPKHEPLLAIPEYRALFPGIGNAYHPNEALASLFPRMVQADAGGKPSARDDALRTWCRANFAKR